jgi:antitoxin HigA-1
MPTRSKSSITTSRDARRRLPKQRPPTHPGEMLLEEFLKPLGIFQSELAIRLGVSFPRLNEIVRGRRSVTPIPHCVWLGYRGCLLIFGLGSSRIGICGMP